MNEAFSRFFKSLCNYYNKNITDPTIIALYEKETRVVPASKVSDLLQYIMMTYEYFPKLPDFKHACERYIPKVQQKEISSKCNYCSGTGLIHYKRECKEDKLSYIPDYYGACICDKGRSYKGQRIYGIEEVFPTNTTAVLEKLKQRNSKNTKSIPELQREVETNLAKMSKNSL